MEHESVDIIRESSRNLLRLNRRFHRDEECDFRRCVESLSISPDSISQIANRLKTKLSMSLEDLQRLKNGLMEDVKYIEIVLNTHGALKGLVRELSGNNVRKQCAAAGCLCNLGLGDAKAGFTVAKAAGPYLIAALDNLSNELAVTCTWAIGNLAGSGPRACSVLTAQGALSKLCALLERHDDEMQDFAMYASMHFGYHMKDQLETKYLNKILTVLTKLSITEASSQLLFILSCHKDFNPSIELLQKLLQDLTVSMNPKDSNKLMYLFRILANVPLNDNVFKLYEDSLMQNVNSFKVILQNDNNVAKSLLWLLGNLYNYCNNNVLFYELLKS